MIRALCRDALRLLHRWLGVWCKRHHTWYRSDFCGTCLRERIAHYERVDSRSRSLAQANVAAYPLFRSSDVAEAVAAALEDCDNDHV